MQLVQLAVRTLGWAVPLAVVAEDCGVEQVAGLGMKQLVAGAAGAVPLLVMVVRLVRSGGKLLK
jgi:hypothetical protein